MKKEVSSITTTERSKSSKEDPSKQKLDICLYTKIKPLLDRFLPNSVPKIASLDNIVHDEPSDKMLCEAFLKTMVLLHDSLLEQQNLKRNIAIERGLAECGDLVHERLIKYRTAWVQKFSNKPLPEIVGLWADAGGSTNRKCDHSLELFRVVQQKHPEIQEDEELWRRYEVVACWIHFYALRCEYFHSDIEKKKKNPEELLKLLNNVLDKFDHGEYEFTPPEYEEYVRMAVEELRDKHFEKDGDVWKSTWTNNPIGVSIERESSALPGWVEALIVVDEAGPPPKTPKNTISKKSTRAEEADSAGNNIVYNSPSTNTSKKRKVPDDYGKSPPATRTSKKRKLTDDGTAKKPTKSDTEVAPRGEKVTAESRKHKVYIKETPAAKEIGQMATDDKGVKRSGKEAAGKKKVEKESRDGRKSARSK
jgi:hypothetical protein